MGGIMSERAGIINIALEGFLLISAFVSGLVFVASKSVLLAFLAGMASGGLAGAAHWFLTQKLKLNHIISGLGLNIFISGLTVYLTSVIFNDERSFKIGFYGTAIKPS